MVVKVKGLVPENTLEKVNSNNELKNIEEIMQNLSKETIAYQNFENTLLKELKTIKDMEDNLQRLNNQIWSMKKLVIARDEIFRSLMAEYNKNTGMDINICRTLFDSINKINQEMNNNSVSVKLELEKLFVEQKHNLYSESEENKRLMNIISEDAKKLNTELILVIEQHNSLHPILKQLHETISRIATERQRVAPYQ
jgi:type VI protein secretion system component VasK